MTKLGKSLVVFLAFASVAFMGFAAVTSLGSTNWKTFLSEKRVDRGTMTYAEKVKDQDEELRRLREELQVAEAALSDAKATREADTAAITAREAVLVAAVEEQNANVIRATKEATVTGNKVIDVKNQTSDRHEEVVRMQNQLKELRSQIEIARDEDQRLADRVIQAKELLKSTQRRNERLKNN